VTVVSRDHVFLMTTVPGAERQSLGTGGMVADALAVTAFAPALARAVAQLVVYACIPL